MGMKERAVIQLITGITYQFILISTSSNTLGDITIQIWSDKFWNINLY